MVYGFYAQQEVARCSASAVAIAADCVLSTPTTAPQLQPSLPRFVEFSSDVEQLLGLRHFAASHETLQSSSPSVRKRVWH